MQATIAKLDSMPSATASTAAHGAIDRNRVDATLAAS